MRSTAKSGALEIAARSMFESRAIGESVEDAVWRRALDHHFRGLFEYAALRVGLIQAQRMLTDMADKDSVHFPRSVAKRPWVEHYRFLRARCEELGALAMTGAAPFWRSPHREQNERLERLRGALSPDETEAAELRFARGLEVEAVAAIVGASASEVAARCDAAQRVVTRLWGRRILRRRDGASAVLREAFALDPASIPARPHHDRTPVVRAGDVVAGRYGIEEVIGTGAFADVYRARDLDVEGHMVALKMARTVSSDERSVRVALRELQYLASVFHPSVVQLKDHGWHEGHLWFVMPLYRGETLAARLSRGPLSRAEAAQIFRPLAEALAAMHRGGVLHQDVKPENIFLADLDPRRTADAAKGPGSAVRAVLPVLLDLGVAAKDAELVVAGTPAYLAPEVAARFAGLPDPALVGPKADVFSLALTLRDALDPETSRSEPPLASVDAFLAQRVACPPLPPEARHLEDLRASFERWLHLSPDERPSAAELCEELAVLTAPAERAARRRASLRWMIPSALAVLSVFALVVHFLSVEAEQQRTMAVDARSMAAQARRQLASANMDLAAQQARERELQANIARLERDYQESRMTREQLASRLARSETEQRMFGERLEREAQRLAQGQRSLLAAQTENAALQRTLLEQEEVVAAAQRHAHRLRDRLEDSEAHSGELRTQIQELERRIGQLELALEHSRRRVSELLGATAAAPAAR